MAIKSIAIGLLVIIAFAVTLVQSYPATVAGYPRAAGLDNSETYMAMQEHAKNAELRRFEPIV